jgi:hypothetical protein
MMENCDDDDVNKAAAASAATAATASKEFWLLGAENSKSRKIHHNEQLYILEVFYIGNFTN